MPSINEVRIMGHAGREPELRHTPGGTAVCNFSIATQSKIGDREATEWHEVVAWKGWAEVAAKSIRKGSLVYVEGRIETQEWEKDGQKRRKTVIQANRVYHLRDAHNSGKPEAAQTTISGDDDDLPF